MAKNQVPDTDGNLTDVRPATNAPEVKHSETQSPRERATHVRLINAQPFETRQLTTGNWGSVGIDGPTIEWSKHNKFSVPIETFDFLSDRQFSDYIEADSRFSVEGDRDPVGASGADPKGEGKEPVPGTDVNSFPEGTASGSTPGR